MYLARGKIFTASTGSVDSLYPSVYIYLCIYIPACDSQRCSGIVHGQLGPSCDAANAASYRGPLCATAYSFS